MPPRRQQDDPAAKRRPVADVMPFVTFHDNHFSVNEAAAAFLDSLGSQPLGVAALAGPYRHGKSFLLNRVLLQYGPGAGFSVGHTVNACTKGLHISTQLLTDPRAPNAAPVLIMDTEGLGAVSATDTHDMRIFSLALLLSSMFLYNSKGTIDQPAINNLALVTNISEHIRVSTTNGSDDLADFFPTFLWIVRDFALDLVDESGAPLAADDYLETALKPIESAEKNKVRERLRTLFKHRGCVTMARPCDDEQALKTLNDLPSTAMKPMFLDQAAALRSLVMQRTQPARVQGMTMTGPLLVRLARLYVDAINKGAAPAIKDSWALISTDECQRAMQVAEQEFLKVLADARVDGSALDRHHERKPISAASLEHAFTQGFEKALAVYKTRAMGDSTEEFRERLRDALRARANKLRAENVQIVARKADSLVDAFEQRLMEHATFDAVRSAFASTESAFYKDVGVDPGSRSAWYECVSKHVWEWAGRFFAQQTTELAKLTVQLPMLQQQSALSQQEVQRANERAEKTDVLLQVSEESLADTNARLLSLQKELAQVLEDLDTMALADRSAQSLNEKALHAAQQDLTTFQHAAEAALAQNQQLQHTLLETELKLTNLHAECASLTANQNSAVQWEQKYHDMESAQQLAIRRVQELTAQRNKMAADYEREMQQLSANTGEAINQLSQSKDEAVERVRVSDKQQRELAATLEHVKRDMAAKEAQLARMEQDMAALRKAHQEERTEHKAELADVRGEASRNAKQFQRQLEEQAAQSREDSRKRAGKMREEVDKLFQEKVTALGRAQQMEARAAQSEEHIRELQATLSQERERARELNLPGKLAMLEASAGTAQARYDVLQATLQEKNDLVAEQQSTITDLEAELRQIQQRHEAEKLRLQLEFARRLGGH